MLNLKSESLVQSYVRDGGVGTIFYSQKNNAFVGIILKLLILLSTSRLRGRHVDLCTCSPNIAHSLNHNMKLPLGRSVCMYLLSTRVARLRRRNV